jgi:hypothetical protein
MSKADKVEKALRELEEASRGALVAHWRRFYRSEPPRYASIEFMRQAVAYSIQEQEFGGLPASAQRELLAVAKGTQPASTTAKIKIKPGTKLLRKWDGATYEVLVTDKGFVWGGTTYSSLSAVAFAITGAKWSGQRFFGLVQRRGGQDG